MRNNWSTNMKIRNVETITHIRYTCQLFLTYKREIFILGVLGFFEDDTIISEDSRRSPKSSEDARSLPKTSEVCRRRSYQSYPTPSLRMHINTSSLPVLFTSKSEIVRKVLSFIHFTHGFLSLHGSELTYFWKLCQARRQQLTFFNQAWEIGPQAWASVRSQFSTRSTPKAWELAGIIRFSLKTLLYIITKTQVSREIQPQIKDFLSWIFRHPLES